MTGLLTILILLGITIAIWQMVKIFDLAQVNKDISQVANDGDNKVQGYLMLAFLGFIYGITIVSFALWGDLPLTSNSDCYPCNCISRINYVWIIHLDRHYECG